jgi:hypothetical protein
VVRCEYSMVLRPLPLEVGGALRLRLEASHRGFGIAT